MFVDRDPSLFRYLLDYMRTAIRPPRAVLETQREALIDECKFYDFTWMQDELQGHTSVYDLKPADRAMFEAERRARSSGGTLQLIHVYGSGCTSARSDDQTFMFEECYMPREHLELPLLFNRTSTKPVVTAKSMKEFEKAFDGLSGGLLEDIRGIDGIIIAGGSVVAALTGVVAKDIDIFVVGRDSEEARRSVLTAVIDAVKRNYTRTRTHNDNSQEQLLLTRSRFAVTIYRPRRIHETSDTDDPNGVRC